MPNHSFWIFQQKRCFGNTQPSRSWLRPRHRICILKGWRRPTGIDYWGWTNSLCGSELLSLARSPRSRTLDSNQVPYWALEQTGGQPCLQTCRHSLDHHRVRCLYAKQNWWNTQSRGLGRKLSTTLDSQFFLCQYKADVVFETMESFDILMEPWMWAWRKDPHLSIWQHL